MKTPSKQYLKTRDKELRTTEKNLVTIFGICFLLFTLSAIVFVCYNELSFILIGVIVILFNFLFFFLSNKSNREQVKRFQVERKGEDIGTFTHLLNYRDIDTEIIRAVYEEFSSDVSFPIRPSDRIYEDLNTYNDDSFDSTICIAERIGIQLGNVKVDNFCKSVNTIEDIINLLQQQKTNNGFNNE